MSERTQQLEYSELQPKMKDEAARRRKALKMLAVLRHFRGDDGVRGATLVDIGSSTGFIADEFRRAGARVVGADIDVPGLQSSRRAFSGVGWLCADGERFPARDGSVDIVVFNHVYEHVVDADAVVAEIERILAPDGTVYLGLGNRWGVMEPHHRLPFLSWLPPQYADRYMKAAGKGDSYHERFRSEKALRRMTARFDVWDYTEAVLAQPESFAAGDMVAGPLSKVPPAAWRLARPIIPTFIWVGAKTPAQPAGPELAQPPRRLTAPA
jgi:SAM-dependent methyltransferase